MWVKIALAVLAVIALSNILKSGTSADTLLKDTLNGVNTGIAHLEGN